MKADPLRFAKGYVEVGLAHPEAYANAFFRMELPLLSPLSSATASAESISAHVVNRAEYSTPTITINETSLAPRPEEIVALFLKGKVISYSPLACVLWSGGFWLWVVLLLFALCCYLRERKAAFIAAFILCYLGHRLRRACGDIPLHTAARMLRTASCLAVLLPEPTFP